MTRIDVATKKEPTYGSDSVHTCPTLCKVMPIWLAKLRIVVHMCPCMVPGPSGTLRWEDTMDANEVFDGWRYEDAKQALDAVRHAADGLITEGEMLAKLKDASGVEAFEQHVG
jgi:hypothetical protein